jgi:hypothetical protein
MSPDGTLRIWADATSVHAIRTDDQRPSSDLVFLTRLENPPARLRWHRSEADDSEKAGHWFAAAFHLRQLIAARPDDTGALQLRLKRCEDKLRNP